MSSGQRHRDSRAVEADEHSTRAQCAGIHGHLHLSAAWDVRQFAGSHPERLTTVIRGDADAHELAAARNGQLLFDFAPWLGVDVYARVRSRRMDDEVRQTALLQRLRDLGSWWLGARFLNRSGRRGRIALG